MTKSGCHIHLDPLGGIAGDMFAAAYLDAVPEALTEAQDLVRAVHPEMTVDTVADRRNGLAGSRLVLDLPDKARGPRHYPDYQNLLRDTAPTKAIKERAEDILRRLGEAEASVHGVPLERVHFHEISDWDSIADILLAAWAIEQLGCVSSSTSSLPIGRGRVVTEHGPLPVPAPATLQLLRGFEMIDDGIPGERITPTGAAILAHLQPVTTRPTHSVMTIGHGLGTRDLDGIANVLRLSICETTPKTASDLVGQITFNIDDQTPEDLAIGLDHIRAATGVLDVLQIPAFGKKGRVTTRIEILCAPEAIDAVTGLCFSETTTIGLRQEFIGRQVLRRQLAHPVGALSSKTVERPGGEWTQKPEADDLSGISGHSAREAARAKFITGDSGS